MGFFSTYGQHRYAVGATCSESCRRAHQGQHMARKSYPASKNNISWTTPLEEFAEWAFRVNKVRKIECFSSCLATLKSSGFRSSSKSIRLHVVQKPWSSKTASQPQLSIGALHDASRHLKIRFPARGLYVTRDEARVFAFIHNLYLIANSTALKRGI